MTPAMSDRARERLLVVDDDAAMCRAVARVLGSRYRIATAANVSEARQLLAEQPFDLALIDIQLMDGDGYTLCQGIHAARLETEVILMTGSMSHTDEKLLRSLEEGAFYFLLKPFERRVLQALVERCLRLQAERRAKERYAAALADDLQQARRFQASLIPSRPLDLGGWHLEGRCMPCDALGGDFYFYQPADDDSCSSTASTPDGPVVLAICDIVGHGVKAAMYAGMMRSILVSAHRRNAAPRAVLDELASSLDFFEPAATVTMVFGLLSPDGTFDYFNAGHPPLILLRRDGRIERLTSTGLILSSALASFPREVGQVHLEPGDRLVTYTDGTFEALDPTDTELGLDAMIQALDEARTRPTPALCDHIWALLDRHCAGRPLDDDTTVLVIDRTS